MGTEAPTLRGRHVELLPVAATQAPELLAAATVDRSSYGFTEVPATAAHMASYLDNLLAKRAAGTDLPFAQRCLADGRLVGCTRYLEIRHWRGRPEPDEVEIGGTWLAADVQRTAINTEAKLLLLAHAFEVWQVRRVSRSPPTAATSAAGRPSSASAAGSKACCATTARRSCPASRADPATRRCSRSPTTTGRP